MDNKVKELKVSPELQSYYIDFRVKSCGTGSDLHADIVHGGIV